ncbi:formyltransferase family protein [Lunatibacter salilacus]|uniref:formyltransferase family protein n=1 Tax=Lunatibacter salilacus TaxID=2483804 RepID=UPI00131DF232|nr:formyltransferase family protein [Lunatibacter salilacus]
MIEKKSANIIYFGLEPNTLLVLVNDKAVSLKAVAKIGDFLKNGTFNPVNILFKHIYLWHLNDNGGIKKMFLFGAYKILNPLSSGIYKKYSLYLHTIVQNNIKIVDSKNLATLQKFVDENNVKLFVVNTWSILPSEIVEMPKFGCLNIHPSKLPKYKGALPTLWALKNGDKSAAVTYILLDHTVDGGKIIAQHEFCISPTDTGISVDKKIDKIVAVTLCNDIVCYLKGKTVLLDQCKKEATKTGKFEAYRAIDFGVERAIDVFNKINLYTYQNPSNTCYAQLMGRCITFKGCKGVTVFPALKPGNFEIKGFVLFIGCKDQAIKLRLFKDINLLNSCYLYLKKFNLSVL